MSSRNSQLEEAAIDLQRLKEQISSLQKQLEISLLLLGEKEEELEAMMLDMKDVKHMYSSHIAELVEQVSTAGKQQSLASSVLPDSGENSKQNSISTKTPWELSVKKD